MLIALKYHIRTTKSTFYILYYIKNYSHYNWTINKIKLPYLIFAGKFRIPIFQMHFTCHYSNISDWVMWKLSTLKELQISLILILEKYPSQILINICIWTTNNVMDVMVQQYVIYDPNANVLYGSMYHWLRNKLYKRCWYLRNWYNLILNIDSFYLITAIDS